MDPDLTGIGWGSGRGVLLTAYGTAWDLQADAVSPPQYCRLGDDLPHLLGGAGGSGSNKREPSRLESSKLLHEPGTTYPIPQLLAPSARSPIDPREVVEMKRNQFIETKKRVAGSGGLGNLIFALLVVNGFGCLVAMLLEGTLRMILGVACAGVLLCILASVVYRKILDKKISMLVRQAASAGRAINAKKTGQYFYDVWLDHGSRIRITSWMLGVLKVTPGVVVVEEDSER